MKTVRKTVCSTYRLSVRDINIHTVVHLESKDTRAIKVTYYIDSLIYSPAVA